MTAAQQNITTVYITTLTYERDTFDLKFIPSQNDITEQPFEKNITVSMLQNSTIIYQIFIKNELLKSMHPFHTIDLIFYS